MEQPNNHQSRFIIGGNRSTSSASDPFGFYKQQRRDHHNQQQQGQQQRSIQNKERGHFQTKPLQPQSYRPFHTMTQPVTRPMTQQSHQQDQHQPQIHQQPQHYGERVIPQPASAAMAASSVNTTPASNRRGSPPSPLKPLNLKISLYEVIESKNVGVRNLSHELGIRLIPLVKNKQYIYQNTTLGYFETFLKENALLTSKTFEDDNYNTVLLFRNKDLRIIRYNKGSKLLVKVGDLVRVGTFLTTTIKSCYSGQVYKFFDNEILIRLGKPYLISEGTIVRIKNGSFIKSGGTLATLIYKKFKTADIVQGLPKVEEILEARKIANACLLSTCPTYVKTSNKGFLKLLDLKSYQIDIEKPEGYEFLNFRKGDFIDVAEPLTEGSISPHMKLEILFNYYKSLHPIFKACQISFKRLQLFLVSEIQRTYSSQGVSINDKHIEVIVKQMTSKVCIEDSGNTTFLPGEIISFQKIETLTNVLNVNEENMPIYTPVLLGITKASLNSGSFISAASFQETTRVLTESAIEGKKDWLNGLKENVIIGRLIPAGTGFSYKENKTMLKRETNELENSFKNEVKEAKIEILKS